MQQPLVNSGYAFKEEMWNAITHGTAALLAIPATVLLVNKAIEAHSTAQLLSYLIFGISMFCLFTASTLYHSIPKGKDLLKKLDHSSIFLLIAGTYTPVALIAIGGKVGWTIFAIEWTLAITGIILKQFFVHRFKALSLAVYIGMGWIIVFAYKPLIENVPFGALILLLIGGLTYTIGTFFYKNHKIPYNHAIWHIFVMAGCIAMYFAIYLYV